MRQAQRDELILSAIAHGRASTKGWIRVNCPFCPSRGRSPDRESAFAFNTATNGFICNRCKIKGYVGGIAALRPRSTPARTEIRVDRSNFLSLASLENRKSRALRPAFDFLAKRRLLPYISQLDIHAALRGPYACRVIIPHKTTGGAWYGFTARLWGDPCAGVPKVLYPSGMDRSILYNEQALWTTDDHPLFVMEGVIDTARYLLHACACFGKMLDDHLEKILRSKRNIFFAFDGDAWRDGAAAHLRCKLKGKHTSFVRIPAGEDPDTVNPCDMSKYVTFSLV